MKLRQQFRKGLILLVVMVSVFAISHSKIYALPTLQLDILGGTYDYLTETIISSGNSLTLYAYLIEDNYNRLNDTYYISAALVPQTSNSGSLGSFTFDGNVVGVTADMVYGVPPLETISTLQGWDSGDLRKHGIFETFFSEFGFQFSSINQITPYNTQDRAQSGGSIPTSGNGMYFVAFDVNASDLLSGYALHFDLYNTKIKSNIDIDVTQFAPFSHDAQSTPPTSVPEPSTLLLLGSGFLGIGLWGRRKK